MARITYVAHDGSRTEVDVELGSTVMQGAIENSVSGIVAECGGSCSCGTCHCYVDQAWLESVGNPSAMEKDIIECTINPQPNSRLSCQIEVTEDLDGLVVYLPEAQY